MSDQPGEKKKSSFHPPPGEGTRCKKNKKNLEKCCNDQAIISPFEFSKAFSRFASHHVSSHELKARGNLTFR